MRNLVSAALIIGGSLWTLFWTFHTIAHGPMNPAPTTGRFLRLSSMEHGMLMTLSSGPFLAFGWLGLVRTLSGRGSGLRWTGAVVGAAGFAAFYAAAFAALRFPESVWPFASGGMLALLIGLFLFAIGFAGAEGRPRFVRWLPLAAALGMPGITYLRRPVSPLLESEILGYLMLESVGALFGCCWIAIAIASSTTAKAAAAREA